MNTVSIVTLALTALYLLISYSKFGMTKSISETFYKWMALDYSVLFVIWCFVVTLGAWLQSLYHLKHETKFILLIAGFFMFCIGIAPTYKDKKVSTLHYVFAALAIILGFLALYVEHKGDWRSWVPVTVFVLSIPVIRKFWPQWTTYIVEVIAFALIFVFL